MVSKLPALITVVAIDKGLRKSTIGKSHCNYVCLFGYFNPQTKITVTSLVFVRFLGFCLPNCRAYCESKVKGHVTREKGHEKGQHGVTPCYLYLAEEL